MPPFTRTLVLPPDTLHLPAPLPAPLSSPKTRELGNFGPNFHSMGAPPWQGSVVACLGSPWDPTGLVSGPLGLVSSRASHRPSRIACTLDSPAPLPSPAPFPKVGTLHPYPRRVNAGKRVPPLPFCCPAPYSWAPIRPHPCPFSPCLGEPDSGSLIQETTTWLLLISTQSRW